MRWFCFLVKGTALIEMARQPDIMTSNLQCFQKLTRSIWTKIIPRCKQYVLSWGTLRARKHFSWIDRYLSIDLYFLISIHPSFLYRPYYIQNTNSTAITSKFYSGILFFFFLKTGTTPLHISNHSQVSAVLMLIHLIQDPLRKILRALSLPSMLKSALRTSSLWPSTPPKMAMLLSVLTFHNLFSICV